MNVRVGRLESRSDVRSGRSDGENYVGEIITRSLMRSGVHICSIALQISQLISMVRSVTEACDSGSLKPYAHEVLFVSQRGLARKLKSGTSTYYTDLATTYFRTVHKCIVINKYRRQTAHSICQDLVSLPNRERL